MTPAERPAVLFLIFNRPSATTRVFDMIRRAAPRRLYIAADGPRAARPAERALCEQTRAVVANPGWHVEVSHLYRENNLGCRDAVSSAIGWFFDHEEEGIILEDDCLPDLSFFRFAGEMLERYRDSADVMHISGDNFQQGRLRGDGSYYFSKYPHVWGWASWRRAWRHYDVAMSGFEKEGRDIIKNTWTSPRERGYWIERMRRAAGNEFNTWDYQWAYTLWKHHGFAILPNMNLVANIGYGADATHTVGTRGSGGDSGPEIMEAIQHPSSDLVDMRADRFTFDHHYVTGRLNRMRYTLAGLSL